METSDSTYLLESWEKVDEQTYKALNYTVSDVGMQLSEQIAIEITDSGTYYKPMIEGLSEGIEFSFKFVSQDDNKYIFENKTYDFPSKIWYKLVDSNTIQAGIENQGGDKRESFIYEKVENE